MEGPEAAYDWAPGCSSSKRMLLSIPLPFTIIHHLDSWACNSKEHQIEKIHHDQSNISQRRSWKAKDGKRIKKAHGQVRFGICSATCWRKRHDPMGRAWWPAMDLRSRLRLCSKAFQGPVSQIPNNTINHWSSLSTYIINHYWNIIEMIMFWCWNLIWHSCTIGINTSSQELWDALMIECMMHGDLCIKQSICSVLRVQESRYSSGGGHGQLREDCLWTQRQDAECHGPRGRGSRLGD